MSQPRTVSRAMAAIGVLVAVAAPTSAQIYNWQTSEVIPGTEAITPGPDMSLSNWNTDSHNLRYADLSGGLDLHDSQFEDSWLDNARFTGADLVDVYFGDSVLTNADLSLADLTGANAYNATLTNADMTNAVVAYATLTRTTSNGFTKEQLYSTASYKNSYLPGIGLSSNDLTDWSFAGQDLTYARFRSATLANTDFTDAVVTGTNFSDATYRGFTKEQLYSTASYKNKNLAGITLEACDVIGWNFVEQNLTNANFYAADLTNADLADAVVASADFGFTDGLTKEQLSATASYKNKDMSSISLRFHTGLADWDLSGQDISHSDLYGTTLTNTDLSNADLTSTTLGNATLTNADLTDAIVLRANFGLTTSKGFTKEQLYSTASYKAKNLAGIALSSNNLTGWDLAEQNLVNADFHGSTMADVDLTDANVTGASFGNTKSFTKEQLYSTTSYKDNDLPGIRLSEINLTGWNLAEQNLTGAYFYSATLTNVDLTDAEVGGANFSNVVGLTKEQVYSTTSYKNRDLAGVNLNAQNLNGWDLAEQNLTNTSLYKATLTGTDLTMSDTRGANWVNSTQLGTAITRNTILPEGNIAGLDLLSGDTMTIRDFEGQPYAESLELRPIAITIDDAMTLAPGSVLQMLFADTDWGSTITLPDGVVPDLGGTLKLGLAPGADGAALVGTTFQLFDWNNQLMSGDAFDAIESLSGWVWHTSNLYTTGTITLINTPEPTTLMLLVVGGLIVAHRKRGKQDHI